MTWTYVVSDRNGEEIVGKYYKIELQKINHKEFRTRKVIQRKDDKLYFKWKGYDYSFNGWIYEKRYERVSMSKYSLKPRALGKMWKLH